MGAKVNIFSIRAGNRYLDLLSGFGVFAIGRNHPLLRDTLSQVLASDLPNLVQMDVSVLAGLLAERLLGFVPYLDKVFFTNSGTEAVEVRDQIRAASDTTPRHCLLQSRFPWLDLWRVVGEWR